MRRRRGKVRSSVGARGFFSEALFDPDLRPGHIILDVPHHILDVRGVELTKSESFQRFFLVCNGLNLEDSDANATVSDEPAACAHTIETRARGSPRHRVARSHPPSHLSDPTQEILSRGQRNCRLRQRHSGRAEHGRRRRRRIFRRQTGRNADYARGLLLRRQRRFRRRHRSIPRRMSVELRAVRRGFSLKKKKN